MVNPYRKWSRIIAIRIERQKIDLIWRPIVPHKADPQRVGIIILIWTLSSHLVHILLTSSRNWTRIKSFTFLFHWNEMRKPVFSWIIYFRVVTLLPQWRPPTLWDGVQNANRCYLIVSLRWNRRCLHHVMRVRKSGHESVFDFSLLAVLKLNSIRLAL